jgi:hypothetical protein
MGVSDLQFSFSFGAVLAQAAVAEKLTVMFSMEAAGKQANTTWISGKKGRKWEFCSGGISDAKCYNSLGFSRFRRNAK